MVRAGMCWIAAGVAALSIGVHINLRGTHGIDPGNAPGAPFGDRFFFGSGDPFDARFKGERISPDGETADARESTSDVIAPSTDVEEQATVDPPAVYYSRRVSLAPWPAGSDEEQRSPNTPRDTGSPPNIDGHTAIYDIVAHMVYLPSGRSLEAHSGLGSHLDDPRFVYARGRGPTPPNVYSLAMRESLFHGVRALRLIPAGDGAMYGRDGILAHSYMLGPSGQSNGCVAFSNYPAFLSAFMSGEIDRLVVVNHLAAAPGHRTASGRSSVTPKDVFRGS